MFKQLNYRIAITAALAALLLSPFALSASGEGEHEHGKDEQKMSEMDHGSMSGHSPEMMAKHEGMMKHHAEMQARLDTKMEAMRQATGDAKVEAMAAVIEELVGQRNHQAKMMGGMGGKDGCKMKKDGCPMMEKMDKMKEGMHEEHGESSDE